MTLQDFQKFFSDHYDQIERMAYSHFPRIAYPDRNDREEMVAITLAICWRWSVEDYVQGVMTINPWQQIKNNLYFAIKQAKSGRDLPRETKGSRGAGSPPAQDIFAKVKKHHRHRINEVAIYFVSDDTPVPDQVQFRIDFTAFLDTLTERQRLIIGELIRGTSLTEVAHIFGVTMGRISQMKKEFKLLMDRFYGSE